MTQSSNATGFVWHELYMWHDTGKFGGSFPPVYPLQPFEHHENPEPKRRIKNLLDASGYVENLTMIQPREASEEELRRFHTRDYIARVKQQCLEPNTYLSEAGSFTVLGKGSFTIAKLSAGGVLAAVEAVLKGQVRNAYALVRPPGHHALANEGMGFCVFGNLAIAAHHILATTSMTRIAVVDWDAHHGNGTQSAFYSDPRVLTISIHQEGWYPADSGTLEERGEGAGFGYCINIPLPAGSGNGAYDATFSRVVVPALDAFKPEFILVACGFDCGALDPMARQMVTTEGFKSMCSKVVSAAERLCAGRLVLAHEGGYHAPTVPFFALGVLEELTGVESKVVDPYAVWYEDMRRLQILQPHQEKVIEVAEKYVTDLVK